MCEVTLPSSGGYSLALTLTLTLTPPPEPAWGPPRDKEPRNLLVFRQGGGVAHERTGKEGGGDPNEASVVLFEEV